MSPEEIYGRDLESAAIDRVLDGARSGAPSVACFSGEPGIGKTTLVNVLRRRAGNRGMLVLTGSGTEFERSLPFGVFVDALDEHLAELSPRTAARLRPDDVARLAPVFPALGGLPDSSRELSEGRSRILGAARALIEIVAGRRPLVLVIDDLHWADDGSLELVSHLIRRHPRACVLLILAYRPLKLAERAGTARAAFITGAADEMVEPRPLSRAAASELVGDRLPGDRVDALWVESGGNPFYLEQLARDGGTIVAKGAADLAGVPPPVAGSLASEFAQLSAPQNAACLGAAVVGDRFEPDLVAAAADIPEATALDAIDALTRLGIARETGVPRRFRFRHPIVRRAAYESAEPGFRLAAHRRVARALETRGATGPEIAHHVEASAQPGDLDAVELLIEAGRATERKAPAIAARWYTAALRLMPDDYDSSQRTGLLVALATAEGSAGQLEKSRDTLKEVLETLPPELEPLRLRVLPFLALVGHMLGRHGESTAMLRRTLAELGDADTAEAAQLGIATAIDCLYEPDFEAMRLYATDAERTARATGDRSLEAATTGVLALAFYNSGAVADSLPGCRRAVRQLAPLTDNELAGRLEGVFSVVWAAMSLELWEECRETADRGLAISRATGQEQLVIPISIARTVARTWRGGLAEAAGDADHLVDAARISGVDQWVAWTLTLRGWIAGQAGDVDLAAECGEEACRIAGQQARRSYFVAHARLHLAETRLEQGRPEECLAELVDAAGGPGLPVCELPIRPRWYEILTRASLAMGRVEEGRTWAERAQEAVAGVPIGGRRCEAALAGARVELADGRPDLAERQALEAAEDAAVAGDTLLAARARLLAARARSAENRQEAIEAIERAREVFVSCGATRLRDESVRELRRLGRRVGRGGSRGRGTGGAESLSRREREVGQLVTEGLTNREIAERLFLSEKTIESHLSAIFRKLGVRRRAAVGGVLSNGSDLPENPPESARSQPGNPPVRR